MKSHEFQTLVNEFRGHQMAAAKQFLAGLGLRFEGEKFLANASQDMEQAHREMLFFGCDLFPDVGEDEGEGDRAMPAAIPKVA